MKVLQLVTSGLKCLYLKDLATVCASSSSVVLLTFVYVFLVHVSVLTIEIDRFHSMKRISGW